MHVSALLAFYVKLSFAYMFSISIQFTAFGGMNRIEVQPWIYIESVHMSARLSTNVHGDYPQLSNFVDLID